MKINGKIPYVQQREIRRNKYQIRLVLLDSVGKVLKKHGFANLGINLISEYSKVDKNTIYRHYKSFQDLLTQYIENQDYWLRLLSKVQVEKITDFKGFLKQIITNQYLTINKDKELQQLLIWELGELSPRTKRIAQRREALSTGLIKRYEAFFKDSGIDFNAISAIIITGIFYLILHKNHSKFCMVDFRTEEDRVPNAINQIIDMIFQHVEQCNYKFEIAQKAKLEGIDIATISKITGIETSTIEKLS